MILLVQNIEPKVNQLDLERLFFSYGEIIETNMVYDFETWMPKGFAFVEMKNSNEALQAMHELNGINLNGRTLIVKKARIVEHH